MSWNPVCWVKGHRWEHRVQFLIMHYWRCERCWKSADFRPYPDPLQCEEIVEREKYEWARSEAEYENERRARDQKHQEILASIRERSKAAQKRIREKYE